MFVRGVAFENIDTVLEGNGGDAIYREDAAVAPASTTTRRESAAADVAKARVAAALAGIRAATARVPPELHAAAIGLAPAEAGGWQTFWTADGAAYYHHAASGVTQWTHPSELDHEGVAA